MAKALEPGTAGSTCFDDADDSIVPALATSCFGGSVVVETDETGVVEHARQGMNGAGYQSQIAVVDGPCFAPRRIKAVSVAVGYATPAGKKSMYAVYCIGSTEYQTDTIPAASRVRDNVWQLEGFCGVMPYGWARLVIS